MMRKSVTSALVILTLFSGLVFRVDVSPSGDDCSLHPRGDVARCGCSFREFVRAAMPDANIVGMSTAHANMPPPPPDCAGKFPGTKCFDYYDNPGLCAYTCAPEKDPKSGKLKFTACLQCTVEPPCADKSDCPEKKQDKSK